MNGYNTSTYLGQPIVKFTKLYIRIERRDGSQQSSGLSNVRKNWCWQMDQERLVWAIKNISRQNTLQIVWTSKTRKRQAKLSALIRVIHKTINSDMATTQTIPEFFLLTSNVFWETSPVFRKHSLFFRYRFICFGKHIKWNWKTFHPFLASCSAWITCRINTKKLKTSTWIPDTCLL